MSLQAPAPARAPGARATAARAAAVLSELVQSLHDESDALVAGDVDALARAVERKSRALRDLAPELPRCRDAGLISAVREAGEMNRQNGRMLAARLSVGRGRLQALLGSEAANGVYSPDGHAAGAIARPAARGVRA